LLGRPLGQQILESDTASTPETLACLCYAQARCFGFRDDRKDFDGFARDVITHPHFSDPQTILRLTHTPEAVDRALAYPGRLVPQVLGCSLGRRRFVPGRSNGLLASSMEIAGALSLDAGAPQ
jgi:hypothetical protein